MLTRAGAFPPLATGDHQRHEYGLVQNEQRQQQESRHHRTTHRLRGRGRRCQGGGSHLSLLHERLPHDAAESHHGGWGATLQRLVEEVLTTSEQDVRNGPSGDDNSKTAGLIEEELMGVDVRTDIEIERLRSEVAEYVS